MLLLFALILFTLQFTSMRLPEGNFVGATLTTTDNIAKPGCRTQCGSLKVPYPFGIDKGCSIDESFQLTCNMTLNPPKLFLNTSQHLEISHINISGSEMKVLNWIAYQCYESGKSVSDEENSQLGIDLENTPFTFSQKNKFTVVGCDDFAVIEGTSRVNFSGSCVGICSKASDVTAGECLGVGCCQASIPKGVKYYSALMLPVINNRTGVESFNPCGLAFLGDGDSFKFRGARDLSNETEFFERTMSLVPLVVDWEIGGNPDCSQPNECKANSFCNNVKTISGYRCSCDAGYEGNPYLDPGCQDINECLDNKTYPCYGHCNNTQGNYTCACQPGYKGNAKISDGCQLISSDSKFPAKVFSLALVFGSLAILSTITGISLGIRKRKLIKLREKFFEKNGGLFLEEKLKAPEATYAVTLFSTKQLRKATDNYSEERIVGRGGYGLVYKGILPDKRVVAIKKSILVDGTQAEQFIHEVSIITQVIHRNVVKLLGCCLEEEVPVLVYEFISNNTLFYHIHNKSSGLGWLSWENRLRVAAEAASALAYLHSQATMPIIHRDVKSANILIDENYTAKISDFGASRLVPLDHDQVTTLVQGTLGYLDPEYFQTSQLTDKSDIYSFGVVLAELITGKTPLSAVRTNEEKNLATYFVMSMKENSLFQIVEPRVLREASLEQLQAVAELVKRCLNLAGEDRPTMREVAMELEGLRKFNTHMWVQQQTLEESISLIPEAEKSDLYGAPFTPYSANYEHEPYSGITEMEILNNNPR